MLLSKEDDIPGTYTAGRAYVRDFTVLFLSTYDSSEER